MLKVGVIGPSFLLNKNKEILQEKNCQVVALNEGRKLKEVDGIIITGWYERHYSFKLNCWREQLERMKKENVVFWGIAHGAVALSKSGRLRLMDCTAIAHSTPLTQIPLEIPSLEHRRFSAYFLSDIRFADLAPNLGVLCRDKKRGPVILRQGNYLASSYVAELTDKTYLYDYWLEMVLSAKMT